jgi:hypothetical protein
VLRLLLALSLFACTRYVAAPSPAAPAPTPTPKRNAAEDYAQTLAKGAACLRFDVAAGQPDVALCDFGQVLAYCRVGIGAGSDCRIIADVRPAPPDAKAETPTEPAKPESPKRK